MEKVTTRCLHLTMSLVLDFMVYTTSQQLSIGERYSLDKVFHQLQAKILQARWIMTLAVKAHPVESCNQKVRFLRQ